MKPEQKEEMVREGRELISFINSKVRELNTKYDGYFMINEEYKDEKWTGFYTGALLDNQPILSAKQRATIAEKNQ